MTVSRAIVVLLVVTLLASFAVACDGGNGDGNGSEVGDTPQADGGNGDASDGDGGDDGTDGGDVTGNGDGDNGGDGVRPGGEAFEGVPLPDGANEVDSVTVSGSDLPFFVPPDADVDSEAFGEMTMSEYEVDESPGDVIGWYEDRQGDWDEVFSIATDEGGLLIWTKDGGEQALWISVSEGTDPGTTDLFLVYGQT